MYNLLDESWIPVLFRNGQFERVGIRRALTEAGRIRQIAASNPMDNIALLRFLLAVLLWCKKDAKSSLAALDKGSPGIPKGWLSKLDKDEYEDAFNLLGDGPRFYQDASLKNGDTPRPIADLLVEFPGADSVNHMRHVFHDGSYGFCPACCALGILRLSVWAPANRFYPASVNPDSAAYAFIEGKNLSQTLCANLPEKNPQTDQAPWLNNTQPNSPDAVARLAWRPRKLWLNVASEEGTCSNCGSIGVLVADLFLEGGWPTPTTKPQTKKFWDADPHLLRVRDGEPISLPVLHKNVAAHSSKFWRDALRLRPEDGRVTAVGPVVNKFTFQDAFSVNLPAVSARTRANLSKDCDRTLKKVISGLVRNGRRRAQRNGSEDRTLKKVISGLVLHTPDAEARVFAALKNPGRLTDDKQFLRDIYQPVIEKVLAATTTGSPLRRREALARAKELLDQTIRKATASSTERPDRGAGPSASADQSSAAKPKRTRAKKDRKR